MFVFNREQNTNSNQEVLGWGTMLCLGNDSVHPPAVMDSLSELGGLQQIVCAESCLLALTKSGRVYKLNFTAESQVCHL